jgi:Spinocerebellar ataxia type 10 protein domain
VIAIRNLCEGHAPNQQLVAALRPQELDKNTEEELAQLGMRATLDPTTGKIRVKQDPTLKPPPPSAASP